MNHDHEIEYAAGQLVEKLERAGFEVTERKGLNLMREGVASGTFDEAEASAHPGVFAAAEECLLLAVVARNRPLTAPPSRRGPVSCDVTELRRGRGQDAAGHQLHPRLAGLERDGCSQTRTMYWVGEPSVPRCQVPAMACPLR